MTAIQFCISYKGSFLFRTEPETDSNRIEQTQQALLIKFKAPKGYKVSRESHTTVHQSVELYNG